MLISNLTANANSISTQAPVRLKLQSSCSKTSCIVLIILILIHPCNYESLCIYTLLIPCICSLFIFKIVKYVNTWFWSLANANSISNSCIRHVLIILITVDCCMLSYWVYCPHGWYCCIVCLSSWLFAVWLFVVCCQYSWYCLFASAFQFLSSSWLIVVCYASIIDVCLSVHCTCPLPA